MWKPRSDQIITAEQKAIAAKEAAIQSYKAAFDAHLDAVAQSRQYDNRISIGTYTASANSQWAAEAMAFIVWRDAALLSMFAQLADFENGGDQPSITEFIDALPTIAWPEVSSSD